MPWTERPADPLAWPVVERPHSADEVLVLYVDLAAIVVQSDLMDARERECGRRLRTTALQQRYLAAHTALRQILGWQSGRDPGGLSFVIDAHGKPALRDLPQIFNLSHSGSHALIALADDGVIGVDLEQGGRLGEVDQLATRVFAASELTRFRSIPAAERPQAFLAAWTRKEAALKALGLGLLGGMEHVVIADQPLRIEGDFAALPGLRALHLVDLPMVPGCAAALCHGPRTRAVRCARWPAATPAASGELPTAGST